MTNAHIVKGHGFIAQDDNGPDVFVHYTKVTGGRGRNALNEGDRVSYEVTNAAKGLAATSVTVTKK